MRGETTKPIPDLATLPSARPLLLEDVYRVIGALHLELDLLRRENAQLRQALAPPDGRVP